MRIILLDLNYTLVSNSEQKINPFEDQILSEEYRKDLIWKLKDDFVILVTARPHKYKRLTLLNIKRKTGWLPMTSFFNKYDAPPPKCKQIVLTKHLINTFNINNACY